MDDSLDDFSQELQKQIFKETKEAYGEKVYRRWQNPLYSGSMSDPDGFARVKGKCGDTM